MDPSKMDKRSKEFKAWAAEQLATKTMLAAVEARKASAVFERPGPAVAAALSAPDAPEAPVKAVAARKPTRPWEKRHGSRPWRRDYFNLEKKRPGFKPRFVDPTKVEGRIQRGYAIADPEHYGGLVDIDIRESKGLGKYISRQGMILMEIPEEGHRAYAEQQEAFIRQQYKKIREEVKEETRKGGSEMEVEQTGLE